MPVEAQLMVGPIGPDTLQIPGEPGRLRQAASTLRELCQRIDDIGKQLRHADAPEGKRGRTVRSLSRIAGITGRTLQADADALTQLGDAVQHQADLLADAHGNLDQLRSRWRQARQELRATLEGEQGKRDAQKSADQDGKGGGGGGRDDSPLDIAALIRSVDGDVADKHEQAIVRLSGVHYGNLGGSGGEGAMLVDGEVDRAMTQYRHQVDALLEELTESMRRVHRADEDMAEHLPRREKNVLAAEQASLDGDAGDQPNIISGPEDIRMVAQDVRDAAQSIEQVADQLREIRLGIREGRMLPDDERIGSSDGFERTWTQHFDELREDLHHARRAGAEVADRLAEIDQNGARDVRRSGRNGA